MPDFNKLVLVAGRTLNNNQSNRFQFPDIFFYITCGIVACACEKASACCCIFDILEFY